MNLPVCVELNLKIFMTSNIIYLFANQNILEFSCFVLRPRYINGINRCEYDIHFCICEADILLSQT
jgi:hypothetical protein